MKHHTFPLDREYVELHILLACWRWHPRAAPRRRWSPTASSPSTVKSRRARRANCAAARRVGDDGSSSGPADGCRGDVRCALAGCCSVPAASASR